MDLPARIGYSIHTYTGVTFWPLDPRQSEIRIRDIARALSMECRYGGQVSHHYSVAQHSCLVHDYLRDQGEDRQALLQGLLHDAAEAYIKDMIKGAKPFYPIYIEHENRLSAAIFHKFGVTGLSWVKVKAIDDRIVGDEHRALQVPDEAISKIEPLGIAIEPWVPLQAEEQFLLRFSKLLPDHPIDPKPQVRKLWESRNIEDV